MIPIMRLNAPETKYMVSGCICAIIMGVMQPAFALIFAEMLGVSSSSGSGGYGGCYRIFSLRRQQQ